MLKSLPFQGTTIVLNKDVDLTIVADEGTKELAMKASRSLVVRGMSTAVLCVENLDPVDERTLNHFISATGAMIFAHTRLYEATRHLFGADTLTSVVLEVSEQAFIKHAEKIIKLKLKISEARII